MTSPLILFFLLTFLGSWLMFGTAVLTGLVSTGFPGRLFHILGGFGPSIVAIIIVQWKYTPEMRRLFWRSLLDFRRIRQFGG